jgi:predicted DNA-binding transcriptional regulator AlpA
MGVHRMKEEKEEILVKEDRVAKILDLSQETLRKWRGLDKGPPWISLGENSIRYRLSDINKYLEQNTIRPKNRVDEEY